MGSLPRTTTRQRRAAHRVRNRAGEQEDLRQTLSATFTPTDTANYATAVKTVTIIVLTPAQATQQLGAKVNALVDAGVLRPSEGSALTATLDAALRAIDKGNANAAKGQLNAFINQVHALVDSHRLTQAQAQPLTDAANAVITRL